MTENDTTTISITTEQKAQLDERKQHERESYKSVIGRLLDGGELEKPELDTDELAREVSRQLDYAQLAGKVGDEIEGRLR